ncbi:ABC transporter permease [Brevibacillus sp. SYSU BS000544]|uniref:ABC transporter permease n=1 Tax=Brevibacillus sp. SYSU BS000544 TaxID=3416443 RepID=UPI003CE474C2
MKIIDSFRIVWRNLWRMKLRTVLTSIGVMIGTAAIVAMISLSLGLKENAVKGLESWGSLTEMEVAPMFWNEKEDKEIPPDEIKVMNWDAVHELKKIDGVKAVMPIRSLHESTKLKIGRREGHVQLIGVDVKESSFMKSDDVEKGEYLKGAANEIVVSYEVTREMRDIEKEKREERKRRASERAGRTGGGVPFGGENEGVSAPFDAVGKTGTITLTRDFEDEDGNRKFEKKEIRVRVVGQLKKEENNGIGRGAAAYVPLAMVDELQKWMETQDKRNSDFSGEPQRKKKGRNADDKEFESIFIKVDKRENVEAVVEQAQRKGYEIYSPASALKEINKMFFVIQMILGGIAAISLLVATIGIVNTMIMSILERTKEIGIMKVIGATVYNIRWLFLIESGFIGLIGGITGLGLAYGAVYGLNYLAKQNPDFNLFGASMGGEEAAAQLATIPLWLALFAIGFSFVIGILAGIFPAYRASRLSPMQAIRSE